VMNGVTVNANNGTEVDVASNALVRAGVSINNASTVSIGTSNANAPQLTVAVNSPRVPTTLIMDDRDDPRFNEIDVHSSTIGCFGFLVLYNPGQIQKLSLLGGTGGSRFVLGSVLDALDGLPSNIAVTGGKNSRLEVNGTGSFDNLYEIDRSTVS